MPLITIGVPTYNREDFALATVERLLRFEESDIEILVSDNASDDNATKRLQQLRDHRLQIFRQPHNIGGIANFDFLLSRAKGEFFILHQDDDCVDSGFLPALLRALAMAPDIQLFTTPYWRGNPHKGYRSEMSALLGRICGLPDHANEIAVVPGREIAPLFLTGLPFLNPGLAYRTATLRGAGGFGGSDCLWGGDILLSARMLLTGSIAFLPTPRSTFHEHESNQSYMVARKDRDRGFGLLYQMLVERFDQEGIHWRETVMAELSSMRLSEVLELVCRWTRQRAPEELTGIGWRCYLKRDGRVFRRYWRACAKLGVPSFVRLVCCSMREQGKAHG